MAGRYDRWLRHVEHAPWAGSEYVADGFNTPKGHGIEHMFAQILLFGAVDNSRLGNAERDHQPWVKSLYLGNWPGKQEEEQAR